MKETLCHGNTVALYTGLVKMVLEESVQVLKKKALFPALMNCWIVSTPTTAHSKIRNMALILTH
jgi:hypothetical protein